MLLSLLVHAVIISIIIAIVIIIVIVIVVIVMILLLLRLFLVLLLLLVSLFVITIVLILFRPLPMKMRGLCGLHGPVLPPLQHRQLRGARDLRHHRGRDPRKMPPGLWSASVVDFRGVE